MLLTTDPSLTNGDMMGASNQSLSVLEHSRHGTNTCASQQRGTTVVLAPHINCLASPKRQFLMLMAVAPLASAKYRCSSVKSTTFVAMSSSVPGASLDWRDGAFLTSGPLPSRGSLHVAGPCCLENA